MDNARSGSSWLSSSLSPWSWTSAEASDEQVPELRPVFCFRLVCHYSNTQAQHTGKPLSISYLALCTNQRKFMQAQCVLCHTHIYICFLLWRSDAEPLNLLLLQTRGGEDFQDLEALQFIRVMDEHCKVNGKRLVVVTGRRLMLYPGLDLERLSRSGERHTYFPKASEVYNS